MHLISISNFDYGVVAALFCIILAISYYFRRKNPSSDAFLVMAQHKIFSLASISSLFTLGILEFILLSGYGAELGLAILWIFLPVFLLTSLIIENAFSKSQIFISLQEVSAANEQMRAKLIFYAIFSLLAVAVAICIAVTMLKSLLGWEFANSTLSLLGVFLIAFLLGGMIATTYNQALVTLCVFIILILVAGFAYKEVNVFKNLQQVAINNKLAINTFTKFKFDLAAYQYLWLSFVASCLILILSPLQKFRQSKINLSCSSKKISSSIGKTILVFLMISMGVFCLAIPSENTVIAGKKIITQQTHLSDGSIGYVVKVVNNDGPIQQRGLIPLRADAAGYANTTLSDNREFDFLSAGMVMVKKIFPAAFISLFLLIMLFFKSVSEGIFFATLILIKGFYATKYNKTGEELENLWATKVFMFTLIVISISLGLLMYRYCELDYLLAVLLIFALPIAINIINCSAPWSFDVFIYLVIILILLVVKIPWVPSIVKLISFDNLQTMVLCLSSSICFAYIVAILVKKIAVRD